MRTRITRTSRPAASARYWKPRSPNGRRCASGPADPAARAGSACATVLTTMNPSELLASPSSWLGRDLAELRYCLLVEAGWQRSVTELTEQLLAVAEQVAEVR